MRYLLFRLSNLVRRLFTPDENRVRDSIQRYGADLISWSDQPWSDQIQAESGGRIITSVHLEPVHFHTNDPRHGLTVPRDYQPLVFILIPPRIVGEEAGNEIGRGHWWGLVRVGPSELRLLRMSHSLQSRDHDRWGSPFHVHIYAPDDPKNLLACAALPL
jgi:hypothetical protein